MSKFDYKIIILSLLLFPPILMAGLTSSSTRSVGASLRLEGHVDQSEDWSSVVTAFERIQRMEDELPPPSDLQIVEFGTFSCSYYRASRGGPDATYRIGGAFSSPSLVPAPECEYNPRFRRVFCEFPEVAPVRIYAKQLRIRFRVRGSCARFEFGSGVAVTTPDPHTWEVSTSSSGDIGWTVVTEEESAGDILPVVLTPYPIGVWGVTLPVVTTALVYAPVRDTMGRNSITFTRTEWIGTSTRASVSRGRSVTTPAPPSTLSTLQNLSSAAGTLTSKIEHLSSASPYLAGLSTGLSTFQSAIGDVTESRTEETVTTFANEWRTKISFSEGFEVPATIGFIPGDVVFWLGNAKVGWLSDGESVQMSLLGYQMERSAPILSLRAWIARNTGEQLPPECERGLLADVCNSQNAATLTVDEARALRSLDPFQPGLSAFRTPGRFGDRYVLKEPDSTRFEGVAHIQNYGHEISQQQIRSRSHTVINTRDEKPGFLKVFGVGEQHEQTVALSMTHSNVRASSTGIRVSAEIKTYPDTPEYNVFFDRLFGTFLTFPRDWLYVNGGGND